MGGYPLVWKASMRGVEAKEQMEEDGNDTVRLYNSWWLVGTLGVCCEKDDSFRLGWSLQERGRWNTVA